MQTYIGAWTVLFPHKTDLASYYQELFGTGIVCWPCLCIFPDAQGLTHRNPHSITYFFDDQLLATLPKEELSYI